MLDQARNRIVETATLTAEQAARAEIEQIAGMTNRNFKITVDGMSYVLRIAGEGTEEYIDRDADEQAAHVCSDAGVGATLLYYDRPTGTQVTRFIEGSVPMDPEILSEPAAIRHAAEAFHRLHNCGTPFLGRFYMFDNQKEYLDVLEKRGATLPDGYHEVAREALIVKELLDAANFPLAPCNNDPAPENLVYTGERAYVLDWEFAGNNDPYWDLADFSIETEFSDEQDEIFLAAYCKGEVTESMRARMVTYKAMAFLLWTLWGVLQQINDNPTPAYHFASYWDYAMDRFTRCQAIMNRDDFAKHLDVIRRA